MNDRLSRTKNPRAPESYGTENLPSNARRPSIVARSASCGVRPQNAYQHFRTHAPRALYRAVKSCSNCRKSAEPNRPAIQGRIVMKLGAAIAEIMKREGIEILCGYPVNHLI